MSIAGPDATLALNDGGRIPAFGLGVYQARAGEPTYRACLEAIRLGYRHIDTAALYGNEADVGRAVRDCGLPRQSLYVTTKLWNSDQGYRSALKAFDKSLKLLGLDYVDLYLIHWPEPGRRLDSWRACVEIRQRGLARSIGVSNYEPRHLDELARHSDLVPAVNQIEMNVFLQQAELRRVCAQQGIVVAAYSPLAKAHKLADRRLAAVAARHGRTPAQVMLRWVLETGVAVIPKSVRPARIAENFAIFDFALDTRDRQELAALEENYRASWDPTEVP